MLSAKHRTTSILATNISPAFAAIAFSPDHHAAVLIDGDRLLDQRILLLRIEVEKRVQPSGCDHLSLYVRHVRMKASAAVLGNPRQISEDLRHHDGFAAEGYQLRQGRRFGALPWTAVH